MRAAAVCLVALALSSAVLGADDHSVIFDEDVDFSSFKSFTVRDPRIKSERPELNFPAVRKTLAMAMRDALTARGLKEIPDRADLVVECSVTGVDYSVGPFGRPNVVQSGQRGGRGGRAIPSPVDFTEATIVIDLKRANPDALLWRGVYHDVENDAQKLAEALPKDAATLLAKYPSIKKK